MDANKKSQKNSTPRRKNPPIERVFYWRNQMKHLILHYVAKTLGLLVHINGLPYGAKIKREPGVSGSTYTSGPE